MENYYFVDLVVILRVIFVHLFPLVELERPVWMEGRVSGFSANRAVNGHTERSTRTARARRPSHLFATARPTGASPWPWVHRTCVRAGTLKQCDPPKPKRSVRVEIDGEGREGMNEECQDIVRQGMNEDDLRSKASSIRSGTNAPSS